MIYAVSPPCHAYRLRSHSHIFSFSHILARMVSRSPPPRVWLLSLPDRHSHTSHTSHSQVLSAPARAALLDGQEEGFAFERAVSRCRPALSSSRGGGSGSRGRSGSSRSVRSGSSSGRSGSSSVIGSARCGASAWLATGLRGHRVQRVQVRHNRQLRTGPSSD
jgi:hypothetical protein